MPAIGFTDNRPHEAAYVVYLNGIEVPVQGVEVSMGVNTNPTASLQMVPDPVIARLGAEDRVEVAVFYLDDIYPEVNQKGARPDFRLLYEGEIVGRSYTNSPMGRSIGFNSVNFLKILYDLYPYFLTGPEALTMKIAGAPQGNDASYTTNGICFPWNRFFYGFDQSQEKLIRRPYDLIMNILNSVVGVKEQQLLGSSVATNFYARYMTRTGFVNRFLPSPLIETAILAQDEETGVFPILRAVRDADVVSTLARGAAEPGVNAAIWPTLQQMFLRMYYEVLTITTAPIAQVDRTPGSVDNGTVIGPPQFKLTEDAEKKAQREAEVAAYIYQEAYEAASADILLMDNVTSETYDAEFAKLLEKYQTEFKKATIQQPAEVLKPNCILNYITKPQWLFGVTPACNVVFPSMLQQLQFQEDYSAQPTRIYVNDMWHAQLSGGNNPTMDALATLRAGYPDQVQRELDKRYGISDAGISGDVRVSGKNFLVWPEEFYRGPQPDNICLPNWFTMLANYIQTKQSKEQQQAAKALEDLSAAKSRGEDLQVQLQHLIDGGVLPPQVKQDGEYSVTKIEGVLKLRATDQNSAMTALRKGYARYEFFRKRAVCRQGAAILTFNPYIIPGFPAFIFDDTASGENLVAYVVGVTHSLAKDSWTTQVTFSYGMLLDEFMQELFDARVGNTAFGVLEDQASAPVNPIEPLRAVLQVQERAEDYFSLLLHRKADYPGIKSCAFDFAQAISLVVPSGEAYAFNAIFEEEAVRQEAQKRKEAQEAAQEEIAKKVKARADELADEYNIKYDLGNLNAEDDNLLQQELATKVENYERNLWDDYEKEYGEQQATAPKPKVPSDLLQKYVAVKPSNDFAPMFRNHTNAMRFVARPICTLDEYIAFRGRRGTKSGTVAPTDGVQGKGAVFYEKILNLKQGPGDPPTFDQDNNLLTPAIADLPDTRADWETRLKSYRAKILFKKAGWRRDPEGL